jgi:hypothetical protein
VVQERWQIDLTEFAVQFRRIGSTVSRVNDSKKGRSGETAKNNPEEI